MLSQIFICAITQSVTTTTTCGAQCKVEVSDCEIFTHHDAWVVIYHDCENYHDCYVMQTFQHKQAGNLVLLIKLWRCMSIYYSDTS